MKKTRFGWLECAVGVLTVLLGIFTLVKPGSAMGVYIRIFAVAAVISGIRDIVFYCRSERYTPVFSGISLTTGIVSLMSGVMLFLYPGAGALVLSLLFPLWFLSHSIFQLANLERVRYLTSSFHYHISLVMSILGMILGILLLFRPVASFLAATTIIGWYLIITGINSIVIAFSETGFGMK